jgi:pimeloyl-ACP methyl ester carboxylesterase
MLEEKIIRNLVGSARDNAEFRTLATYMDSTVRFSDEDNGWLVRFSGDEIGVPERDSSPTARWDYELFAPAKDWAGFSAGNLTLIQALGGFLGTARLLGDGVRAGADLLALCQLIRLLHPKAELTRPQAHSAAPAVVGRYVDVNGIRTYYESFGDELSPITIITLHTAGHDGRQYHQFNEALARIGRVICPDFPGHGKSWPTAEDRSLRSVAELDEFVWAFRSAIGIREPIVIVGCSLGGNLAFSIAANHHDDVLALISFEGADFTPTQTETTLALLNHPRINPGHYGLERTRSLIGSKATDEATRLLAWSTMSFTSPVIQSDLIAYGSYDFRERMSEISCPCLLVHGDDDWLVQRSMVSEGAQRLTGAPVVKVVDAAGVGHYPPTEQPKEMAQLSIEFLAEVGIVAPGATER